jgi:hypothetical protein
MERDIRAETEDPPGEMNTPAWTIIYNFALTAEGDKCVVEEIDSEGRVRRIAYELPNGINSKILGPTIGEVMHEHVQRNRWDQCLPEGWKPSSNTGHGEADGDRKENIA